MIVDFLLLSEDTASESSQTQNLREPLPMHHGVPE